MSTPDLAFCFSTIGSRPFETLCSYPRFRSWTDRSINHAAARPSITGRSTLSVIFRTARRRIFRFPV
jgi:hypothetical protein